MNENAGRVCSFFSRRAGKEVVIIVKARQSKCGFLSGHRAESPSMEFDAGGLFVLKLEDEPKTRRLKRMMSKYQIP